MYLLAIEMQSPASTVPYYLSIVFQVKNADKALTIRFQSLCVFYKNHNI